MTKRLRPLWALMLGLLCAQTANAEDFDSPDILILGDSQLPFGSGQVFVDFFSDLATSCNASAVQRLELEKLGEAQVAAIGVRSTSLPTWLTRSRRARSSLCEVDPNWRVNAGSFGVINTTGHKYVQIGQGEEYQFCASGQSAFETMFRPDYYAPKLTLMTFLGNSSRRWADSPEAAFEDVEKLMQQLPDDMGCIFMTTQPAYKQEIVDMRLRAQENMAAAFELTGSRCAFVPGATEETIAANLGVREHFRRRSNGSVKDPYHPNERAARRFFDLQSETICAAVFDQLADLPPMAMAEVTP